MLAVSFNNIQGKTYLFERSLFPTYMCNYIVFILHRSSLDDDEAFLTTADSAIRLLSKATRTVREWKGLEYRAAFPILKPAGANFYPPDMDKMVP